MVATVGFWDRQVEELMAGIAGLLGGDRPVRDVYAGYSAGLSGSEEAVTHAGQTVPGEWAGRGVEAVNELHESIRYLKSARAEADRRLGDAVAAINVAAQHARERLQQVRAEVDSRVGSLQSAMDTTTGQQQMAEFLAAKTKDVRAVIDEARDASATHIAAIDEARAGYDSIRG